MQEFQIFHIMSLVEYAIFPEKSFSDDLVDIEFVEKWVCVFAERCGVYEDCGVGGLVGGGA